MLETLLTMWDAMLEMIEAAVKKIHPDDCSMTRFVATSYFINWLYLPPIIYRIILSGNPEANTAAVVVVTLLTTAIWAIFCSPITAGVYFAGLLIADLLTTSLRWRSKSSQRPPHKDEAGVLLPRESSPTGHLSSDGGVSINATIDELVTEMQRMQTVFNLIEAERNAVHALMIAVEQRKQLLGELTKRLDTCGKKLHDIWSHVGILLAHALPGELESALKDFRTACIDTHTQARAVDAAMNELQAAHEALKADRTRQRISPEETLNASKATLSRAQKASELTLPVE